MAFPVKERVEGVSFKSLQYEVGVSEKGNDYQRLAMTLKKGKDTVNHTLYPIDPTREWYQGDDEKLQQDVANLIRQINQVLVALWGKETAVEINTEAKQNATANGSLVFEELWEIMSSRFKKDKKYKVDNLVIKTIADSKTYKYVRIPRYGRWLINPELTPEAELDPYTGWEQEVVDKYRENRKNNQSDDSRPKEELSDDLMAGFTVGSSKKNSEKEETKSEPEQPKDGVSVLEQEVTEDDLPF